MSITATILTATDAGMELSREEFGELETDPKFRFERVQGRLVVMAPAGYEHHVTAEPIRNYLVVYAMSHPEVVEHVFQESWTAVEDDTDRIADISVFLKTDKPHPPFPEWVPDLVFEIVSSGWENRRRDYQEKRDEYERIGVSEYVIVDRFDHQLTVLALQDGRYVERKLKPHDTYATSLLPGLAVPLAAVLS